MPGPLLTVTIAESARRGWRAGPLIILGHGLLEGILVLLLAVGFAAVLSRQGATAAVAVLGGGFLVYTGYGMVRDAWYGRVAWPAPSAGAGNPTPCAEIRQGRGWHPVLAGVLISLANPYWSLWWATVGLHYINMTAPRGSVGLGVFFSGHILADLAWYGLVAVAVAAGRHLFPAVVLRGVLVACGLFMVGLGLYFGVTGVT